ncbi:MAG TPA: hypothetical protein VMJ64_16105, partial [Anaerolineales bacterium]|nr:hypothetical protein [Anaerolineales bacterium]
MIPERVRVLCALALLVSLLSSCAPGSATPDLNAQMTQAVQTALVSIQQTETAVVHPVTETPGVTPTTVETPPALAAIFTS